MAERLVLIRHGTVEPAFQGRFIGRTDANLGEDGHREALALAKLMSRLGTARILCSPLRRAQETARIAIGPLAIPWETDPDLREADFGDWEGMTFPEIRERHSRAVDVWAALRREFSFPGGDRLSALRRRARRFAEKARVDPSRQVVAFTHGGTIRFLICHFLGLSSRSYLSFDVQPASRTIIALHGKRGVLTLLNDRSHLDGLGHG